VLFLRYVVLALLVSTINACGSDDESSKITGSVSFADPVVPQSTWRVIVTLEDDSVADASSVEIGSFVQDSPAEVPIRYEIGYAQSSIIERNSYNVAAQVLDVANPSAPVLLFISEQSYPVLTQGFGSEADIIVVAVN